MGGRARRRPVSAFAAVLAIGLLFAAVVRAEETGTVVEVVDGDTLRVRAGRIHRTVRLIGIDAPERYHPSKPEEFLAVESAKGLASLCDGKTIRMETDREDSDRHGRLLRYVFLPHPDGRLVNREMIRLGYARVLRRYPFSRRAEFDAAEEEARRDGFGVWREDGKAGQRWARQQRGSAAEAPAGPGRKALPAGIVPWEEARLHVGREVVVEGKVVRTHRGKEILHLDFHPDWRKHASVVVKGKDLLRFPWDPETFYKGKTLRVRGKVVLYKGRPEIVVRAPEAISFVE